MRRSLLLFLLACVALAGSLTAVFATAAERDLMLRGVVDATTTTDLPYRIPRLGVNADLTQYEADELPHHFDLMQQAGITWVRQYIYWDQIEPAQGDYQWQVLDTITEAIRPYEDLRLVLVIMNSPAWARPDTDADNVTAPPAEPADIATFATGLATRYGDVVDYYQIWDEPNLDDAWGKADPRPADYAALICQAGPAIRAADAGATVILGALAPTTEISGQNIADWRFLDQLYAAGAQPCFDAAAAKPYGFDSTPSDRTVRNEVLNLSRLILMREVMVKHQDGRKTLWASQWGWNSLPTDWTGQPSIWGQVTQEQQQAYTAEALTRADREWPWLGGMVLQHWQPNVPADDAQWGYSVLAPDGTPNALYNTLANTPRETARNGVFHPITPYARYSGIWTFSNRGADIGWLETSDSQLEFDFTGRDVALWTRQDDYVAFLYPTIDGQASNANALPQDNAGNAYLFLRSASLEPELNVVPLAHGLPDAAHTLHIVADRGWDRWALAGYAVSEGDLAQPYRTQITLAALTAVVCMLAVLYTGWQIEWTAYRPLTLIGRQLGTGQHLVISLITSLALMVGLLLTWGDSVPTLFRRDTLNLGALIVLSGGLLVMQPGLILTLITLVLLFWLIYQRLEHGLMLALIFAPYFLFPLVLYKYSFPMVELITIITAAAWALRGLADWGQARRADPTYSLWSKVISRWRTLDTWVLAWLVLGFAAMLWSARRESATTEFRTFFIEPALFYAMLRTTIRDAKTLRRCVDVLILSGLVMAVIGLVAYGRCVLMDVCTAVIEAEGGTRRLASVYGSPNNVALFLERCLPFVLAFLLIPGTETAGKTRQTPSRRFYYGVTLIIMLVTILLTQSVGALILGVPVGIGVVLIGRYGRRAVWPIIGVAGIGTVTVAILSQVSTRFASLLTADRGTNFIRLRLWESTFEILRDHPIMGLGLDQFLYVYRDSYIRPDAVYDRDLSHPHNVLLDFWIRLGIGGALLLVIGQILFWRSCLRLIKAWQTRDQSVQALIIGVMGAMAALLAHGMIDNSVYVLDLVYIFMLLWAIPAMIEEIDSHAS